ncbi:uncharacterized protein EDB93DRAFT_1254594 [Suillus bovinus]|uniref:uncharacterized protein n=1 Tax=Suillus bovinus TaxID=48563 RepID=UPI001B862165|nr:uncharacterized protein EDB93DRAFT_1254594 [Suillus bovinus]KAG2134163.1 hypothetical protein EDB93DRAFT_1254594 [Suillus bovinus]
MTRKRTEGLVALNVQGLGVHTAHTVTSIMTIQMTKERIIATTETNTTSLPRVVGESEVAVSYVILYLFFAELSLTFEDVCINALQTVEHRRRSSSPSPNSAVSMSSEERGGSSRHRLREKSPSRRSRSRSRSDSRDIRKSKSKHREKDRDKKHKRHRDRDNAKDKDERRSVLTGKKIKLKVHKDARDLEMDANRQNLLQFLNSTCE